VGFRGVNPLCLLALKEVREARFIGFKLFLAVFGRCLFVCVHSVLLLDEMELHVCLGVDLGGLRHCMWVDSDELC